MQNIFTGQNETLHFYHNERLRFRLLPFEKLGISSDKNFYREFLHLQVLDLMTILIILHFVCLLVVGN